MRGFRNFSFEQEALLEELAADTLHEVANEATRRSGWGRIEHPDGSFDDVAPHNGGIVGPLLDNVAPISADDDDNELGADWDSS